MNPDLFEQLLNDNESSTLDFKAAQYLFEKSSDNEKSKLLKDILAFANSWKRTDAYILIGVQEVKGGRSIIKGISEHLEDASLQQFVNSKLNKTASFSYIPYQVESKQIGIIKIPLQERPIYLKKNFGSLKKDEVYYRRGSSTAIASPEEIFKMGESSILSEASKVAVDFEFFDEENRIGLGKAIVLESILNEVEPESKAKNANPYYRWSYTFHNEPRYEDYAKFTVESGLLRKFTFVIYNTGDLLLENLRLKIKFEKKEDLLVKDEYPKCPMQNSIQAILPNRFYSPKDVFIHNRKTEREIIYDVGDIQPKDKRLSEVIYIGSKVSTIIDCSASMFANNLPEPVKKSLEIKINTQRRTVTADSINQWMYPTNESQK